MSDLQEAEKEVRREKASMRRLRETMSRMHMASWTRRAATYKGDHGFEDPTVDYARPGDRFELERAEKS